MGEGSRNVRSVMEPELPCLCKVGLALPFDETEPDRWALRFVGNCPTGVGVVGRERRAAAAAAFDKLALEARLLRKAWTAAVEAAAVGVVLAGWTALTISHGRSRSRVWEHIDLLGLTTLFSGETCFELYKEEARCGDKSNVSLQMVGGSRSRLVVVKPRRVTKIA